MMSGGQERDLKRLAGWFSDVMLERYGARAADSRAKAAAQRMKRGWSLGAATGRRGEIA